MNKKDEALRLACKAFLIIQFGGNLTPKEGELFCNICAIALPRKYRFSFNEFTQIKSMVELKLSENQKLKKE